MPTSSVVAEINKLRNHQLNLEKDEYLLIEHTAKYFDARIMDYYKNLETSRDNEIKKLQNEMRDPFTLSRIIKETISGKLDSIDFKQLKKNLELMQTSIQDLKCNAVTKLENLHSNQIELSKEVKAYEQKIQEWEKHINFLPSSSSQNNITINKKIDQRITDFLSFVTKSGGHENGWSPEDHNLFLKIKTKCKNEQEVAEHVHAILPDISQEEVIEHDRWYIKYLELKSKHKEAIKKWRMSKSAPNLKLRSTIHQIKKRPITSVTGEILDRNEIKHKLECWRAEKLEKLRTAEQVNKQRELQKKQLEKEQRKKYEEIKRSVQMWKFSDLERKENEKLEKLMSQQKEKEFKTALANRLIKEFQAQDDIFIKRKKECLKTKAKTEVKLNVNIVAPRDPKRLLKPTKQWILRTNEEESGEKDKNICSIKDIPKLGVPEWRKQLAL